MNAKPTVIVCWSQHPDDRQWFELAKKHIAAASGDQFVIWDRECVRPGADWQRETVRYTEAAVVAVFLISADFICRSQPPADDLDRPEMDDLARLQVQPLLRRASITSNLILPLVARPCAWQSVEWLAGIEAFPPGDKALSQLQKHDESEVLLSKFGSIVKQCALRQLQIEVSRPSDVESLVDGAIITHGAKWFIDIVNRDTLERLASIWGEAGAADGTTAIKQMSALRADGPRFCFLPPAEQARWNAMEEALRVPRLISR